MKPLVFEKNLWMFIVAAFSVTRTFLALQAESKTPSEESKNISDVLQKANLTDSMIDKMSDSMIAEATLEASESESCHASSGVSSAPPSEFSSQPPSDVCSQLSNEQPPSDVSSVGTIENTVDCLTSGASSMEQQQTVKQDLPKDNLNSNIENLTGINGNLPDVQSTDLLGSLNGHATNGVVDNSDKQQQNNSR